MQSVITLSSFDRCDWEAMHRLSDASQQTEGAHSTSVMELKRLASDQDPVLSQWQPEVEVA